MIRVADYIAQELSLRGIRDVFMVTGGAAMHLNDAFGRSKELKITCCHHEQACAIAAESYFRLTNRLAAVNVTAGPGGINALNGVFGAYVDSMGMIILSGQSKWETLVRSTSLPLRQLGDQEVDIVDMVKKITKYAVVIQDPESIRYHLERALYLAIHGRPGPVWLDIPINVQGAMIDPEKLEPYNCKEDEIIFETKHLKQELEKIITLLAAAKRPVIYAGTGIRLADQYETFFQLVHRLRIPVVTAWNSNDLLPDDDPVYAGRPGTVGNRTGNFVVQNADFVLVLGSRLNIRLISYNWKNFAPHATLAMVDIDAAELKKPTLKIDIPIHANLREALPLLLQTSEHWQPHHPEWMTWCKKNLERYPIVTPAMKKQENGINPYFLMEQLFLQLEEKEIIVCADGTASVVSMQAATIKSKQRLFHNSGCASMGYDLPAVIGAAVALSDHKRFICIAGDGSIMMNLQELQTIVHHHFPVKIFILNNHGYHSIRQTQHNFFADNIVGCDTESGLSFPDFQKVAAAFDLYFERISTHAEMEPTIKKILTHPGATICEVMLNLQQSFEPKLASRKLDNGIMVTANLEDMAPFLSREELAENNLVS
ncbi:MAG: thiamine pyrophosphate-binding protein [Chthoniobacterales bacterium]|nr:thiamine pyrophosphate-binding protein [Chthoniobacterales bacterium]